MRLEEYSLFCYWPFVKISEPNVKVLLLEVQLLALSLPSSAFDPLDDEDSLSSSSSSSTTIDLSFW